MSNEIFTKLKLERIPLSDGYFLLPDGFRGIVLQKETEKTRVKKDGTEEKYIHFETIYQPSVSKVLNRYLELSMSECKDIKELKEKVEQVEKVILSIKERWD